MSRWYNFLLFLLDIVKSFPIPLFLCYILLAVTVSLSVYAQKKSEILSISKRLRTIIWSYNNEKIKYPNTVFFHPDFKYQANNGYFNNFSHRDSRCLTFARNVSHRFLCREIPVNFQHVDSLSRRCLVRTWDNFKPFRRVIQCRILVAFIMDTSGGWSFPDSSDAIFPSKRRKVDLRESTGSKRIRRASRERARNNWSTVKSGGELRSIFLEFFTTQTLIVNQVLYWKRNESAGQTIVDASYGKSDFL